MIKNYLRMVNKMKKRIIVILTVLVMLISHLGVSAASCSEKALFDITALGIFIPDENGDFRTQSQLKRSEFATAILRFIGYEELEYAASFEESFTDVSSDSWYYNAVQSVYILGIMNGDGDGQFNPDSYVTFQEAMKTVVSVLGYSIEAENKGGWPSGYMSVGHRLRLSNGIELDSGEFTRGDLAVLLYNALDINILEKSVGYKDEYYIDQNTYRKILLNKPSEKIRLIKGVVSANAFSYTRYPVSDLKEDEIVLNNMRCSIGSTNADEYLGQIVEAYVHDDSNGKLTILGIREANNNFVLKVRLSDIISSNNDSIGYLEKNNREKIKIDSPVYALYNGSPIDFNPTELLDMTSGFVTFTDTDGEKHADHIFIEEYENILVERVGESAIFAANGFSIDGGKSLSCDFNDKYKKYIFYNKDGQKATINDVTPDSVISIFSDRQKSRYKVYIGGEIVNGYFSEYSDESIVVGENAYSVNENTIYKASVGDEVELYTDSFGNAVLVKSVDKALKYASIVDIGQFGLRDKQILLAVGKNAVYSADVNSEDMDNVSTEPILVCENEGLIEYTLNDKVLVDGKRYSSREAFAMLEQGMAIKFENRDNYITELFILSPYAGSSEKKLNYNIYDKTFGGNSFVEPFGIDEKTIVVCIPEKVNSEEDYMVRTRIDKAGNTVGYTVLAYDLEEDTNKAGLMIITKEMDSNAVSESKVKSSVASVITDVRCIIDEDDNEKYRITLLENNGEVTYETIEKSKNASKFASLREGDLISYYLNDSDLIEDVLVFRSFKTAPTSFVYQNADYDYKEYVGDVSEILKHQINAVDNYLATVVLCDINGTYEYLYIQQRNSPPVYIYDYSSGEVRAGALDELIPSVDRLYVLSLSGKTPRACVILRNE